MLIAGAKLISFNEKQRGFQTGLRFMADENYRSALLFIDSSLEKGQKDELSLIIEEVEVQQH